MLLSGGCTYKDVFGKFDSIVFYFNAAAHHCLRFTELSRNACSSGRQNNVVRVHEGKQIVLFGLLVRASFSQDGVWHACQNPLSTTNRPMPSRKVVAQEKLQT